MADRDGGVDLREIERVQNRKFNQLLFVVWTVIAFALGVLAGRWR